MPYATVNGVELHYREAGAGFPIVLIHGFTGNLRNWALTVPALIKQFRTISPDLPGHGRSGKPVRPADYTLDLMAEDVYSLIRRLGVDSCYLAGHSMGGMIAQHLLLSHPQPFRALLLVDTAAEALPLRNVQRARFLAIARDQGMEAVFEAQLRANPQAEQLRARPQYVRTWKEQFLQTSVDAYVACGEAMADRPSLLDELSNVAVPTLIVCGENDDPFVGPSRDIHRRIAGSELAMIHDAGHTPQIERPEDFNGIVMDFLSRVHSAAAARS